VAPIAKQIETNSTTTRYVRAGAKARKTDISLVGRRG
jgi:hypothetical protein